MRKTVLANSIQAIYSASLLIGIGMSVDAHAQDASQSDVTVQRVEITGSSIKRASIEGALPVQTINHEDIQKMGVTTTEQLLQSITANSMVGATNTAESSGAVTYGEATASLRGLGANHTLVLVDGRRLADYATDGTAVDINSIPLSMVDRIEVLKDGASSIYGSDAIGGVINFITRKKAVETELSAYGGRTKEGGGSSLKVGFVTGFGNYDTDRFSVVVSGDADRENAIYGSQRSYASGSWNNNGNYDWSATPSGNLRTFDPVTVPNSSGVIPNALNSQGSSLGNPLPVNSCAQNGSAYDSLEGACSYNPSPVVDLIPQVTRENLATNFRFKVDSDTEFFVQAFGSHASTFTKQQPSPYNVSFLSDDNVFVTKNIYPAIILSPTNPSYPSAWLAANAPSVAGQPVTVSYRAFDGGPREKTDIGDQVHFVAGFKGEFKTYDYDIAFVHNSSTVSEYTQSGFQSMSSLVALLSNNNAFNPYTTYQSPALSQQILATNYNGPMMNAKLTTDSVDGKISGEIVTLPAGPLSFALGGSVREEKMNFQPSAAYQSGDISGYGGQELPLLASRHSESIFGELDVPIVKSLESDIALRTDQYPNATSTNPKISFSYHPIREALFRASYGTGFREPALPELYTQRTSGSTAEFTDPQTGNAAQWIATSGGNPNLKPEHSEQSSFGVVLDPVKSVSLSVDYYKIAISNLVTALSAQFIVDQQTAGNPAYASLVQRDALGNITNIDSTNLNAGSESTSGVDIDLRWQIAKTDDFGNYGLHLNGTYVNKFNLVTPDGQVQHSVGASVDANGNPLNAVASGGIIFKWRHELSLDWNHADYSAVLTQHFQSGYDDAIPCCNAQTTPLHIGSFSTWDIQGSYKGFKHLTLSVGMKNIFNRYPPNAITLGQYNQVGYDPTYYDVHGQFLYATAAYKF